MSTELTPLPGGSIDILRRSILMELDTCDPAGPIDPILDVLIRAKLLKQVANELVKAAEAKVVESLKAHGEPGRPAEVMVAPTVRLYVGETKTTKLRSAAATMATILELADGDEAVLTDCMSANAFKYGAVRTLIHEKIADPVKAAEKFNECFEVTVKEELETGKPVKGLKMVDTRYLKG